jgi:hypothetical protein
LPLVLVCNVVPGVKCPVGFTSHGSSITTEPDGNYAVNDARFLARQLYDEMIFVVLVVYSLNLPYTPAGLPWNDGFDASLINYTPFAIVLPLIFGVWYLVSAKDRYQGPVRTLEEDVVTRD